MATFNHMPMGKKGLHEVYEWVDEFVNKNSLTTDKKIIGKSPANQDIPAIFVTNKDNPIEDKQIAVVTLARHGQELGARVVGPEILNYLVSDEAKGIRDTQVVIVVPVVNPDGFILNEFHSSMTRITNTERTVLGGLFKKYPPDMMIDYHSLGKTEGSKYDRGDMEVIIPSNTTRWGMDEQIHQHVAQKMKDAAESAGWPFEIHTIEDLAAYYFGGTGIGNMPWSFLKEKMYLLHMQDFYDNYDTPEKSGYTNYTCGPAYLKWHTMVYGIETNHWSITDPKDLAVSGRIPCSELLKMGSQRFSWEKDTGYPLNILQGDFRISIRPVGKNAAERRVSRSRIWNQRMYFNYPYREMPDSETTKAKVRYFGKELPIEFALCLRMRQDSIQEVIVKNKPVQFETFKDRCSTFLFIPLTLKKAGTLELEIKHPAL
ncbi:MAG: hypothetical protein DRH24_08410 [Deltaproteobacteria bacterium]|nr:MAG: hypothetical protein DRH24_08410 [Deltaproteobacteria bacterium]